MFNEKIIPFEGTASIRLYQPMDAVKNLLSVRNISYSEEIWQAESETIPNPWTVILIEDTMSLFFASNRKLFKIVFWENYRGSLANGICTGMKMSEAQAIDSSLVYDDWNEDYGSEAGYWLEDRVETQSILSISVFIKELLDDNSFDYCWW